MRSSGTREIWITARGLAENGLLAKTKYITPPFLDIFTWKLYVSFFNKYSKQPSITTNCQYLHLSGEKQILKFSSFFLPFRWVCPLKVVIRRYLFSSDIIEISPVYYLMLLEYMSEVSKLLTIQISRKLSLKKKLKKWLNTELLMLRENWSTFFMTIN